MGPGHGPRPPTTPTATRLATLNADQWVHQPREGRGRNKQTPPQKEKKTQKGGTPTQPRTRTRQPTGKKENGGDSHTTAKLCTHSTRGGQPPQPGNTKGDTHGAPRKSTGGPPRPARRRPAKSSGPPRPHSRRRAGGKDTPDTAEHIPPEKWRATGHTKKKTIHETQTKGGGGADTKWPKTETGDDDQQRARTRQSREPHPQTPPSRSQEDVKKKKRGGEKLLPRRPPHNPTPQAAPPGGGGKPTERTREGTRPNTPARDSRVHGKPKPTHTHHKPQPGMAERARNPYTNTHTLDPSQEWQGYHGTRPQMHTPRTPARNGGAKPKPECKHTPWTPARNGGVTARPRPKHKHHTTVGNPVSMAQGLRQPVPCS